MSDLIIISGHLACDPWEWGLTATGQAGRAATDIEKSALKSLNFRRLIIVIPGQQVITKLHTLGQLSEQQKRQAVGFSIEDELAATLDDSHIALDTGGTRLAVIANRVMDDLLADMAEHGLSPDLVCADYDSFENTDSFTYEGRVIQRAGNGLGFAAETELVGAVLDAGQNTPPAINSEQFLQKIATALQAGHTPLNLRQGQYIRRANTGLGRFRRSGLLAAGIALAFIAGNIIQGYHTSRETALLKAQINDIYTEIFPNKDLPDNPTLAVIRAQDDFGARNKQEFVKLSALLATSTEKVSGVEISSIRYEQARGQLALSIQYSSFEDVERLKQVVTTNGGLFAESGTRQSGGALNGDAILRLKP